MIQPQKYTLHEVAETIKQFCQTNHIEKSLALLEESTNLPSLVSSFAGLFQESKSYSGQHWELAKQRQSMLALKNKELMGQNHALLEQLVDQQAQITRQEEETFDLKLKLERKQQQVIQFLTLPVPQPTMPDVRVKESKPVQPQSEPHQNQLKQLPQIAVPKPVERGSQTEGGEVGKGVGEQRVAGWEREKRRLVGIIREKELKIYGLIQELQSTPK